MKRAAVLCLVAVAVVCTSPSGTGEGDVKLKVCKGCKRPLPPPPRDDEERGPEPGSGPWLFVGMSGSGKSHKVKEMAGKWQRRDLPLVWFDTHREMSVHGLVRELAPLGPLREQVSVADFLRDPERYLLKAREDGAPDLSLAIVPNPGSQDDPVSVGQQFCEVAPKIHGRGNCIFGVTEVGAFAPWYAPAAQLLEIAACGWRKDNVVMVCDFQFLVQAPPGLRAQARRLYLGRQVKKAHRDLVAAETSTKVARQVRRLGRGEFLVFDSWDDPDAADDEKADDGREERAA